MNESSARRGPISRWSLGTKLIIIFLALVIIPMSVTAYYNLAQSQNKVEEIARENLMGLSYGTSLHVERILTENQRTSATLAGEPVVIEFLAASGDDRRNLFPRVNRTLQNFADTHPDYDAPGILDVNGVVVASTEERLVGRNRSFRDYFQASIKGEPYVSDILVGRATGRPGVFLTNPVITVEGEIVGIDLVWLKADTIWDIIDGVVVGEGGVTYMVDQDGVIIAHPDRDLLYYSMGNLTPEAVTMISETVRFGTVENSDTPLIPQSLGMDDLAAELVSTGSGTYRYYSTLDHRYHVVGYTRLESYPWTVAVDLPESQFLAPLQRMKFVAWGSVGLAALIALIISFILVRSITRPIRRLTDAAVAVEHSQPFEPSDIKDVTSGSDEIAHLGRVFSSMVTSLRQELTERKAAEDALRQSVADLKRSNTDLEQFAYVVSHDLQEPLRMVSSYVQLLSKRYKDKLDSDADDFIGFAVDGASRMQTLIHDLLKYSRVGTRGKPLTPTDCETLLWQTLSDLKVSIDDSGAVITHDALPTVMADGSQLTQVFRNLIGNAIKFKGDAPSRIHVAAEQKGGEWEFSVADNGIGISLEYFERIFVIFQRLHGRDEYEGTGIGLAVCKKIVERHGGRMWVESEPGSGSTFYFTIPIKGGRQE